MNEEKKQHREYWSNRIYDEVQRDMDLYESLNFDINNIEAVGNGLRVDVSLSVKLPPDPKIEEIDAVLQKIKRTLDLIIK